MPLTITHFDKFQIVHKAGGRETQAIVAAHAGPNGSTFAVPAGMKITFYVDPHEAFQEWTASVLQYARDQSIPAGSTLKPRELLDPHCPDYDLSKYQDYHGKDWGAFQFVRTFANSIHTLDASETMHAVEHMTESYDHTKTFGGTGIVDFVTVRYRPFKGVCRFSEIVTQLDGLGYRSVHCAFCR